MALSLKVFKEEYVETLCVRYNTPVNESLNKKFYKIFKDFDDELFIRVCEEVLIQHTQMPAPFKFREIADTLKPRVDRYSSSPQFQSDRAYWENIWKNPPQQQQVKQDELSSKQPQQSDARNPGRDELPMLGLQRQRGDSSGLRRAFP